MWCPSQAAEQLLSPASSEHARSHAVATVRSAPNVELCLDSVWQNERSQSGPVLQHIRANCTKPRRVGAGGGGRGALVLVLAMAMAMAALRAGRMHRIRAADRRW